MRVTEITSPEIISQELCASVHKKCSARSTHIQRARHPGTQLLQGTLERQKCHCIHVQSMDPHTQGKPPSPGKLPEPCLISGPHLLFPQDYSPPNKGWEYLSEISLRWPSTCSSVALRDLQDLLTRHCSFSTGRSCTGASTKDRLLAASVMETHWLGLCLCLGLLPTHSIHR